MQRNKSIVVGTILIFVGVWALLSSLNVGWARMDRLWPAVLMAGGAASLYGALSSKPAKPDGLWFGVAALLSGAVFLYITVGPAEWGDLRWLWPVFPVIGGLAWVVAWVGDRAQVSNLVTGIVALVVGALGFLYTRGGWDASRAAEIAQLWPLILVIMGVGLILQFLVQRKR